MFNFDQILVFIVLLFILISLYKEILGASFTFVIGVLFLGLFGILTPKEILNGFANEQVAVIIILLLLGDVIRKTGAIEFIFDRIFKNAKSYNGFLSRMMLLVAGFSAFLNNTPLVAVMMPYVNSWCKRSGISPSKFLMPLSYAAILGGCATLIGTSTNLIINGLVVDQKIIPNLPSINIFEFSWVGIPMVIIGFFYILFLGNKLLPDKKAITDSSGNEGNRQYIIEGQVRPMSHLANTTIANSGLLDIKKLYILEILRKDQKISAISPDIYLEEEDILILAGNTDVITSLLNSNSGLTLQTGMMKRKKHTELIEIVISHNSTLINKKIKEVNFRARYDGALIAVHRNGERLHGKLREISIKAGDVILLFTGDEFLGRSSMTQDFYLISKVKDFQKYPWYKIAILLGGTLAAILLAAFKLVPLFISLLVIIMATLVMKISTPKELPKSIDYDLGLIIVMSLALGTAMMKSGAAELIADLIITAFLPLGKIGMLFGIYFITAILAAYITNKAAVAILFPISLETAVTLELPYMPFVLVVSFAAAANFMTPHGYQTNLMVYGPGGYSFKDFFRLGFPLTILYMITCVIILSLIYF